MGDLPSFDELASVPGLGLRHAWGVFGDDDRIGSVNLLTPARVLAAAAQVRTGEVVSLDLPLDLPDPPLFGRQPYRHHVFALNRHEMDDRLDDFHLQGSTQWDALGHVRCREHGFWGGRTTDPTAEANDHLPVARDSRVAGNATNVQRRASRAQSSRWCQPPCADSLPNA